MAVSNIVAQVTGGQKKIVDNVTTIKDLRLQMNLADNYVATMDGTPVNDNDYIKEKAFVSFAEKVKGA
jgi:hypothetical protein